MLLADIQRWREHARPVKWGVGCAGIYLGAWWVWDLPFPARANDLLSAAVSVSAISIGFIATAMSILASSGASPYIQKQQLQPLRPTPAGASSTLLLRNNLSGSPTLAFTVMFEHTA